MITRERYLTRLKAMKAMAESTENGGEATAAKLRFNQERARFYEFGFKSYVELDNTISEESKKVYTDEDFGKTVYDMGGKRIPHWKSFLISACAMQQQCIALKQQKKRQTVFFGPEERIQSAIWLYEQLVNDILRNAETAWNALSKETQRKESKRPFKSSYCSTVATIFFREEKRKKEERIKDHYSDHSSFNALISLSRGAIDIRSEQFARSNCPFTTARTATRLSSALGTDAGTRESHKVANRRMTAGQKRLGAG